MDHKGRIAELEHAVEILLGALDQAPDKRRIDFQAYWDWYDGLRVATMAEAQHSLKYIGK